MLKNNRGGQMIRIFFTAFTIIALGSPAAGAAKCLSGFEVSEFITKNSVGVVDVYFSHVEGVPNSLVFKLRNGKVLSVTQERQCVLSAEVTSYKEYLESTIDDGECLDGCGE
ncbi:hypothetical protein PYH37_004976 [Sinorhizobium numidicum]|uniref:Uncharacterized protein n=1 Tax=Sinorhizobium numidicum TaxID=680248 RepID=A0ABY8CYW6_9HYPH|nr:hypothetical protein [Sinorhizobium numidicum]WEX76656.1 hypothetical protein PYH37_004976 [Sinorhizobium numidicum]WEX83317.1 hypothetical protein PYH38_005688 [Sinorhizobium numidicum]